MIKFSTASNASKSEHIVLIVNCRLQLPAEQPPTFLSFLTACGYEKKSMIQAQMRKGGATGKVVLTMRSLPFR